MLLDFDDPDEMDIYRNNVEDAFIAGAKSEHKELTRWRDPKEELPVRWHEVILKIKDCDEDIYYRIGVLYDNDRFQFAGYRIGSEIIGWREIHE